MRAEATAASHHYLKFVLPMEVSGNAVIGWLLNQKNGGCEGNVFAVVHPLALPE
jgi:hypothetical protein